MFTCSFQVSRQCHCIIVLVMMMPMLWRMLASWWWGFWTFTRTGAKLSFQLIWGTKQLLRPQVDIHPPPRGILIFICYFFLLAGGWYWYFLLVLESRGGEANTDAVCWQIMGSSQQAGQRFRVSKLDKEVVDIVDTMVDSLLDMWRGQRKHQKTLQTKSSDTVVLWQRCRGGRCELCLTFEPRLLCCKKIQKAASIAQIYANLALQKFAKKT